MMLRSSYHRVTLLLTLSWLRSFAERDLRVRLYCAASWTGPIMCAHVLLNCDYVCDHDISRSRACDNHSKWLIKEHVA